MMKIAIWGILFFLVASNGQPVYLQSINDFPGNINLIVYPADNKPYSIGPTPVAQFLLYPEVISECQFSYVENPSALYFRLYVYISEVFDDRAVFDWFIGQLMDIELFVDGISIMRFDEYRFIRSELFEDSPIVSAFEICFESNFIIGQHAYKLKFTNRNGEQYIYQWGIVERYPQIWE